VVVALALAVALLHRPGRAHQPDQEAAALSFLFWLIEGCIRTAIFLGYLLLLSRVKDLRRVFEYHGASTRQSPATRPRTS